MSLRYEHLSGKHNAGRAPGCFYCDSQHKPRERLRRYELGKMMLHLKKLDEHLGSARPSDFARQSVDLIEEVWLELTRVIMKEKL